MKRFNRVLMGSVILILSVFLNAMIAVGQGRVVVYSSNQQEQNDMMATSFEKATGIKCEMIRAGTGILLKKMQAEKGRPLGDVVIGLAKTAFMNNMELWEPYKVKDFAAFPDRYKDPNGMWIGKIVHVMVGIYNTKLVPAAQAPKGWGDFLDPRWQDKVLFCNPANSSTSYIQLAAMLTLWGDNEAGWKKVEKFLKHATITEQSANVYVGVANGEFPTGLTMEYAAYRYVVGGGPMGVIYPEEGTVAFAEGAAIIKGCQNRENARKFMDWVMNKEARRMVLKQFMRRPAREDIDFSNLVPGMVPLSKIKLIKDFDEDLWIKKQPVIMQKVKDTLLRIK